MIASYCDLSEAYNRIIMECYSQSDADVKIRCSQYLNEYAKRRRTSLEKADKMFFNNYFLKWLPYKICIEDEAVIDSFYIATEEYIRLNDLLTGSSAYNYFAELDSDVKFISHRLMCLKREMVKYNNSFLISKIPCVIDFDRYKAKKNEVQNNISYDSGKFKTESFFRNNSIVLSKIDTNPYFIRLYFNEGIVENLREKDVLDIKIIKKDDKWVLDEINGCYHPME